MTSIPGAFSCSKAYDIIAEVRLELPVSIPAEKDSS